MIAGRPQVALAALRHGSAAWEEIIPKLTRADKNDWPQHQQSCIASAAFNHCQGPLLELLIVLASAY
jgi:hypothetical protein